MIAVPWDGFDDAVESAGSLEGKIVIDTTNQYGNSEMPADGQTAASFHAAARRRRPLHEELQHADLGLPGRGGLQAGGPSASSSGSAATTSPPSRSSWA